MRDRGLAAWVLSFFLLGIIVFHTGCSKDELLTATEGVFYTGTFSNGGCEWIIRLGNQQFQPQNLPLEFQIDGLDVSVTYRLVRSKADCPNPQNYSGLIHLHKIRQI